MLGICGFGSFPFKGKVGMGMGMGFSFAQKMVAQ
jgi:hypothetical protein